MLDHVSYCNAYTFLDLKIILSSQENLISSIVASFHKLKTYKALVKKKLSNFKNECITK